MSDARKLVVPAIVVGVLLLVVAIIYLAEPARSLPSFFPGHSAGSATHHVKHAIAAVVVALAAFAFAWFSTGPKAGASARRA